MTSVSVHNIKPTTVHFENRSNDSEHPAYAMLTIDAREKDVYGQTR